MLLQDGKPVAYASKALTPKQQAYAQIEKEALALVFGCERFHHGRDLDEETDQKPLEIIMRKPKQVRVFVLLQFNSLQIRGLSFKFSSFARHDACLYSPHFYSQMSLICKLLACLACFLVLNRFIIFLCLDILE